MPRCTRSLQRTTLPPFARSTTQLVSRGLIRKTESEYKNMVVRLLTKMRMSGELPFGWIADSTRWMRKPTTDDSLGALLSRTAETYRRDFWATQDAYVEIWLEKEALAGVLVQITDPWDVPLMVTRGYSSITFLHSAAAQIRDIKKPTYLYYFGDHDPSGKDISRNVRERITEFAPDADVTFERVAVTPEQIAEWELPTRPTKKRLTLEARHSRARALRSTRSHHECCEQSLRSASPGT